MNAPRNADGSRCPVCHVTLLGVPAVVALATGVALGSVRTMPRIREIICEAHRNAWTMALVKAVATTGQPVIVPDMPPAPELRPPPLPSHMLESVQMWIERGEPHPKNMGRFFRAVLENRLVEAFGYADEDNIAAMRGWAAALHNDFPIGSWGNAEAVAAWYAKHHPEVST